MPRARTSAAISRSLHWLIGRPERAGASQASATIRQTCSSVMRAGVPERGASVSRSEHRQIVEADRLQREPAPAPEAGHIEADVQVAGDLGVIAALGCRQHDARAQRHLLGRRVAPRELFQRRSCRVGQHNRFWFRTTHRYLTVCTSPATVAVRGFSIP